MLLLLLLLLRFCHYSVPGLLAAGWIYHLLVLQFLLLMVFCVYMDCYLLYYYLAFYWMLEEVLVSFHCILLTLGMRLRLFFLIALVFLFLLLSLHCFLLTGVLLHFTLVCWSMLLHWTLRFLEHLCLCLFLWCFVPFCAWFFYLFSEFLLGLRVLFVFVWFMSMTLLFVSGL